MRVYRIRTKRQRAFVEYVLQREIVGNEVKVENRSQEDTRIQWALTWDRMFTVWEHGLRGAK
jgi:hypothetical protein